MKLQGKLLENNQHIESNILYSFKTTQSFAFREEIDNKETKVVDEVRCTINLDEGQKAVFGKEYRGELKQYKQSRADIMCVLFDESYGRTASYIYEIKHKIRGNDRVWHTLDQLCGSITQREIIINDEGYNKYEEKEYVGVITSEIDKDVICNRINKYRTEEKILQSKKGIINSTALKMKQKEMPQEEKRIQVLERFLEGQLKYDNNKIYELDVIYLTQKKIDLFDAELNMEVG